MILNEFRKFAVSEIEPKVEKIENEGTYPSSIVNNLAELGLLGLIIPENYGGVELDMTSLCIAVEEISKVSASIGAILVVNNCLVAYPLMKFGNESQKGKYLNKLAEGEIGGFVCKPEIDLPEEQNDFKIEGENLIFTGHRNLVLNGETAEFSIFPIQTNENEKYFILDNPHNGLSFSSKNLLGMRTAGFMEAGFDNVILQDDFSFSVTENNHSEIRDFSNIGFSAVSLGIAQAGLETSMKYANERIQFGKQIVHFSAIRDILAEMKIRIESARLLVYDAASKFDAGEDFSLQSKIARHVASETAFWCGLNSIQVYGGYGYMKDYPLERYFRDSQVIQLLETSPRALISEIADKILN